MLQHRMQIGFVRHFLAPGSRTLGNADRSCFNSDTVPRLKPSLPRSPTAKVIASSSSLLKPSAFAQENAVPAVGLADRLAELLKERNVDEYLTEATSSILQLDSLQVSLSLDHGKLPFRQLEQHTSFLSLAVQEGRIDAALTLLQHLPASVKLWTALLKDVAATGNQHQLQEVIQAREAAGYDFDAYTATAKIVAAGKANSKPCVDMYTQEAWSLGYQSNVVCCAAIQAYSRCGHPEEAFGVHSEMQRQSLLPNIRVFNALIQAAGQHHDQARAQALYTQLCCQGLQPTGHTYSLTFQAFCSGAHDEAAWLLQVVDSMPRHGVQVNEYIIVSFLNAVRNAKLKRGQVVILSSLISKWLEQARWNGSAYAAMLSFCADRCRSGSGLVRSIWSSAQQARCPTNPVLASSLFSACGAVGSTDSTVVTIVRQAHAQLEVFWRHRPPLDDLSAATRYGGSRGYGDLFISYNALLRAYCECHCLQEAEAAYQSMPDKGLTPTLTTTNTLISGYAQAGDAGRAFQLLQGLHSNGLQPDIITYGALMHACATSRNLPLASTVFRMMKASSIEPTAAIYGAYIDAHVKAGKKETLQQAFQVFEDMQASSIAPTAVTMCCLLVACRQLGDADKAFDLYRKSCELGLKDDSGVLDELIQVCAATKRLDEGLDLVKQLQWSHGHDTHSQGLDCLTRALAGASVDRALRMLSLLRTRGASPSSATLLRLILACAQAARSREARRLYWELRRQGAECSASAGSRVILALCLANKPLHALSIFDDMVQSRSSGTGQGQAPVKAASEEPAESEADWGPDSDNEIRSAEPICVAGHLEVVPEEEDLSAVRTPDLERWVSAHRTRGHHALRGPAKPQASAMGVLVQTLATDGLLQEAFRVYAMMRSMGQDAVQTVKTCQPMWQALIEACCRSRDLGAALKVFDDWKTFSRRLARGKEPSARLSNVTLAFLEACCRSQPAAAWRVFDVCAEMRHQSELRRETVGELSVCCVLAVRLGPTCTDPDLLDCAVLSGTPAAPAQGLPPLPRQ